MDFDWASTGAARERPKIDWEASTPARGRPQLPPGAFEAARGRVAPTQGTQVGVPLVLQRWSLAQAGSQGEVPERHTGYSFG